MDLARRVTVTLAEIFCVVGTLVGTGVIGTRVAESSGGALAADATLLAPAGPAFSIWSVIYLGLAAYTVWQWLPAKATDERARATGWLAAASMVLNAAWLLVTQAGWIWVSVLVILALLTTLVLLVARLARRPARSLGDRIVLDGTFGLYLGWVGVATCANVAAALAVDITVDRAVAEAGAVLAVLVVLAGGAWLARSYGGRWPVALASAWGLAWIAVGRLGDSPESVVTAVAAITGAIAMIALVARFRSPTLPA
ncbi:MULTISPECIES: tryptophan-rich sensory protein [unclassified Nocardioides]|uniref:tryptophan-rich sensory protein n=1 Tax=unclassified Nocardioides TaxID=2615069 RepID=UPI0030150DE4